MRRKIEIYPGVSWGIAGDIVRRYQEEEEAKKDAEGRFGMINATVYTAHYGNGVSESYEVYQTATKIVVMRGNNETQYVTPDAQ